MAKVAFDGVQLASLDKLYAINETESAGSVRRQYAVQGVQRVGTDAEVLSIHLNQMRSEYNGTVPALVDNVESNKNQITQIGDTLTATANRLDTLYSNVGDASSRITDEETARTQADQALSQSIQTLQSQVSNDISAALQSEAQTRADADSAMSSLMTTLNSTVGDNTTSLQTHATSIDGLKAQYTVKIDNNGFASGFGLASTAREDESPLSEFYVLANRFAVIDPGEGAGATPTYPFVVSDGKVILNDLIAKQITVNDAQIENLSVEKLFAENGTLVKAIIGDGEIDNAMIGNVIKSNNYQSGVSGWRLLKNGDAELSNATVRGTIDGALINASKIVGSVVVGSAFVAPTELDPGNNSYVGFTTTLSWSATLGGTGWTGRCNIYSANYSNTSEFRRFRRKNINFDVVVKGSGYRSRMIVELGSTRVIDTGNRESGSASGSHWSGSGGYTRYCEQRCTYYKGQTTCSPSCHTDYTGWTFKVRNLPFTGNGRIRVYMRGGGSVSIYAYNDY